MGRRPYNGRTRREIRDQILAKQAYIKNDMIPRGWTTEAVDFTNRLIQRKPYKRLGKQGIQELKQHNWFAGFEWEQLENKQMKPPFVPNIKNVFEYLRNLTEDFTEMDSNLNNSAMVRKKSFQNMFEGYDSPQIPLSGSGVSKQILISKKHLKQNKQTNQPRLNSSSMSKPSKATQGSTQVGKDICEKVRDKFTLKPSFSI